MFLYQDPTETNFLESQGALDAYRNILDKLYFSSARIPNSAFTLLEAFSDLTPGTVAEVSTVSWIAFPRTASASFDLIDTNRFTWQDEYVEWRTEKSDDGKVTKITFTTEFPEYYQALAEVSLDALIAGIKETIPGADPTVQELLGLDSDTTFNRALRFRRNLSRNPWNNGEKGILCLTQQFNTLGALFNLLDKCGVPRPAANPNDVCDLVGGACGSGRNSDPFVCVAAQNQARTERGLSLADPAGIKLIEHRGIWRIDGRRIDINDLGNNQGVWEMSRGNRRGVLKVVDGLTLDGSPITSGAQVSTQLIVGADVITAPETALPDWAKIGEEARI